MKNKRVNPIDEKLPLGKSIPLGFQHIFGMYIGAITVPLILGNAMSLSDQSLAFLISAELFTLGIATLIQTLGIKNHAGIKLPVVLGCSFISIGPMIAVGQDTNLPVVFGGVIVSGIFIWLISGFFGKILRFFPPLVTGIIIVTVGLSLFPVAINNIAGGLQNDNYGELNNLMLGCVTVLIFVIGNRFFKGFLQTISLALALLIGTIIALFWGMIDIQGVINAKWFSIVTPFYFGFPEFRLDALLSLCLVGIVVSIESIGVYTNIGESCNRKIMRKDIVKGLRGQGISNILSGILNSFPSVPFSQNAELTTLAGIKSRYAGAVVGFILIILGLIPKLSALITVVPIPVLGGITLVMFGMILASGFKILSKVDFSKQGNLLTLAISIGVGAGLKFTPDSLLNIPLYLRLFLQDGIIPASFLAILLNIIFNFEINPFKNSNKS